MKGPVEGAFWPVQDSGVEHFFGDPCRSTVVSRITGTMGATVPVATSPQPTAASTHPSEDTMEYMLMFRETANEYTQRNDPAAAPAYWGAWNAYIGALHGAGIVVSGNGLMPPDASTTVRVREGRRQVQDGPFAATHEHLGGYVIVNVPSLDEALDWAARAPCAATGSTEVRPVMPPPSA